MRDMETNMTKGSPYRLLFFFSIPLIFGNLFQQFYSMVDTIVVGRFVGVNALAAVGATSGFSFMVIGFGQGLTMGFSVLISQYYGADDKDMMRKSYAMSILSSFIVSIMISLIFIVFSIPMLRLIETPENIIDGANIYISIIYGGIIAVIYYNLFSSVLRAVGDSKSPLIFLLVASLLNIAGDLFLVIVIPMGVAGVAIATVVSQAVSALLCYVYINRKYPVFRVGKKDFKIDFFLVRRLLKIGLPGALHFSVCAIGVVIVQAAINKFGSDTVAAYSVGNKIENVITVVYNVFGMAISTYAGQNLGSGKYKRIVSGFKAICVLSLLATVFTVALAWTISQPLSYLFVDKSTTDPEIINMSVFYVRTISFFFPFLASIFIFRTGCQGLGSGSIPMISSISELIIRALAAFILPSLLGYTGVVLASPFAWVIAGIICPVCYYFLIKDIKRQLTD